MKNVFVQTQNVKMFSSVATNLVQVDAGVPGMALIYGKRGLGKTRTAIWLAAKDNNVYVRAKRKWTPTWLLEELSIELQNAPVRSFRVMFQEVCSTLLQEPRLIMIDEIDLASAEVVETIRDIHDITGTPIILIGMEKVKQRLVRFAALYDRFLYVRQFESLSPQDIHLATKELLDKVEIDLEVVEVARERTGGNFRKSIVWMKGLEEKAFSNGIRTVSLDVLRRFENAKS